MGGYEWFTVPADDVPRRHYFNGLVNTAIFRNLSTVAGAYVVVNFDDGAAVILYAGDIFHLEAQDTSAQQDTGKIWGPGYYITGDNANAQLIKIIWTTKAPITDREPVTV